MPLSQWNKIELVVTSSTSATGSYTLYLNGVSVLTASSVRTNTASIGMDHVSIASNVVTTAAQTFWADDFSVDTIQTGDSSSLNVADGFHVGGTSSFAGNALFQSTTNSTTAFQIQNAAGASVLTVSTLTGSLTVGNATDNFTISGTTFEPVLNGTAQHAKSVVIPAEYAGSVLDAANDSSCVAANNGTMTSGLATGVVGFGNKNINFYNWTSTQATNQCYDVAVQIPIPGDFASWNGAPTIQVWGDSTANTVIAADVLDTAGTQDGTAYGSALTPTAASTWQSKSFSSLTGTYTNNQYFTVRVRTTAKSSANVRIGNITLNYKAKY